jgi:hypothetical protein
MKRLIILAVAASLVGCHSRSNEAAGAAPDRGDTTATHVVDPHRTGPPGTAGRPGGATVNVDSLGVDTSGASVDTSAAQSEKARRSIPQDTLGPSNVDTTRADTTAR